MPDPAWFGCSTLEPPLPLGRTDEKFFQGGPQARLLFAIISEKGGGVGNEVGSIGCDHGVWCKRLEMPEVVTQKSQWLAEENSGRSKALCRSAIPWPS